MYMYMYMYVCETYEIRYIQELQDVLMHHHLQIKTNRPLPLKKNKKT